MPLPNDFNADDLVSDLMGDDFSDFLKQGRSRAKKAAKSMKISRQKMQDLRDKVQRVLSSPEGLDLLNALAASVYFKPVFPPPRGMSAEAHAAQLEGQRQIVALLFKLAQEGDTDE